MDPDALRQMKDHLEYLDDRCTHRIRALTSGSLIRPTSDELEKRISELADYTLELKDLLRQVIEQLGSETGS
jgi:hypothetical protein